jgi:superfamily II DNA helicase RecQ
LKFFQVPVGGDGMVEEELNRFLRAHRVLRVEREMTRREGASAWAVCVEYLEGAGGGADGAGARRKVDYKEVLNEADFAVFSALRELRKILAEAEGVPVYAVFTNDQLAKIAQEKPKTKADLEKVEGVGAARVEKFGERVLGGVVDSTVVPP